MKEDNTFCTLRLGQCPTCSVRRWWNVCGRHITLCEGVFTVRVRVPGVVVVDREWGRTEPRGDAASRGKPPQAVHSSCSLDALH